MSEPTTFGWTGTEAQSKRKKKKIEKKNREEDKREIWGRKGKEGEWFLPHRPLPICKKKRKQFGERLSRGGRARCKDAELAAAEKRKKGGGVQKHLYIVKELDRGKTDSLGSISLWDYFPNPRGGEG